MQTDGSRVYTDDFFVITGGPGSGKSTVIDRLGALGYCYVQEVARQIIQEQLAAGGDAVPWKDTITYRDIMLERSITTYHAARKQPRTPLFFDRGIPDVIGYSHIIGAAVPEALDAAARELRYNPHVFIAPPWKDIYEQDAERKQTFTEALEVYETMVRIYTRYDYTLVELPRASVAERADYIIRHLRQ